MVRMLVQIRRAPGMTDAAFYDHWLNVHGPLVRSLAPLTGLIDYVQSHRIASAEVDGFAVARGWQPAPDGQAELTWPNREAMLEALSSAKAAQAGAKLRADEALFTDPGGLRGLAAISTTIFDQRFSPESTGLPVKMVIEVWKRPDLSDDAFHARWSGEHAALACQLREAMGFARYVQNHRDRAFPIDLAAARGWLPSPDGISELWWSSETAMRAALTSLEAVKASALLAADELQFVDATRMSAYLAVEQRVF